MKFLTILLLGVTLVFSAVDINTAGAKELRSLHGIGTKKADAILAYRKNNCFKNIEDLAKVKGVGNKTIEKNKDNLRVSECNIK